MAGVGEVYKGRYEVLERISGGQVGQLMRCRDLQTGDDVIVKRLRRHQAEHEREVYERARGVGILPKLLGGFENPGGLGYLVLEYVPGQILGHHIRGEAWPPEQALPVIEELIGGLGSLHRRGCLHLDVHPGNLLIDEGRSVETLRLVDLGTGLVERGDVFERASDLGGTWEYMPPEQFTYPARFDRSSDLYAAAGVAARLLTGRAPFLSGRGSRASYALLHQDRPVLELANVALKEVLERAMAPDPRDRYRTASNLVDAIRGAVGVV